MRVCTERRHRVARKFRHSRETREQATEVGDQTGKHLNKVFIRA